MNKTTKTTKKTRRKVDPAKSEHVSEIREVTNPKVEASFVMSPEESVCDRARRLTREKQEAEDKERSAKKQAFLDSMFKPGEYMVNQDGTYTICGWKWRVSDGNKPDYTYLSFNRRGADGCPIGDNFYRGILLREQVAYDLTYFGQALINIDKEVAAIDKRYPNTFLGRIKHWMATH